MTTTFRKRSCKTHFCSFGYSDIIKGAIFTKSKVIKSSYPHAFSYDLIKPKHNEINFKERFKSCGWIKNLVSFFLLTDMTLRITQTRQCFVIWNSAVKTPNRSKDIFLKPQRKSIMRSHHKHQPSSMVVPSAGTSSDSRFFGLLEGLAKGTLLWLLILQYTCNFDVGACSRVLGLQKGSRDFMAWPLPRKGSGWSGHVLCTSWEWKAFKVDKTPNILKLAHPKSPWKSWHA